MPIVRLGGGVRIAAESGTPLFLPVPVGVNARIAVGTYADENLEIMKAYMCKQRGIRLIKLPMKGTELDYANNLKKAFQSVCKC